MSEKLLAENQSEFSQKERAKLHSSTSLLEIFQFQKVTAH